jgi:quercetin dioxygenase-like cupin family protein
VLDCRAMKIYTWSQIEREQLTALSARQVIHTEKMTVAHLYLAQGCVVPRHSHENEQLTVLQQGKLRFVVGESETILEAGSALQVPPNAPHMVEALEDSIALDLFSPPRQDWISGSDAYLRGKPDKER